MQTPTALACLALFCTGAFGQVLITDALHDQFVVVDSDSDGSDSDSATSQGLGPYSGSATAAIGDPVIASGTATEVSAFSADGADLFGTLTADSFVSVGSGNGAFNYTSSTASLFFSVIGSGEIFIDIDLLMSDDEPSFAYADILLRETTSGDQVFRQDYFGIDQVSDVLIVALPRGDYQLTLGVSAESQGDGPDGQYSASSELSFDITIIPGPWTAALALPGLFLTRRRP